MGWFGKNITKNDINNDLIKEFEDFIKKISYHFEQYNKKYLDTGIAHVMLTNDESIKFQNIIQKWKESFNNYFFWNENNSSNKNWIVKRGFLFGGPQFKSDVNLFTRNNNEKPENEDIFDTLYYHPLLEMKHCLSIIKKIELEESKTKIYTELNQWIKSNLFLKMFTLYQNIRFIKNIADQLNFIETKINKVPDNYLKILTEITFKHLNIEVNNILVDLDLNNNDLKTQLKWKTENDEMFLKYKHILNFMRLTRNSLIHTTTFSQTQYNINKMGLPIRNLNAFTELFYLQLIINFNYILNEL